MREQLAQGGEIAQGVLREVFRDGFCLYPDPNGGRYLWARTRTALPADWLSKRDADGHLPAEYWPRVYAEATDSEATGVAEPVATLHQVENSNGSGGRI